MRHWWQRVEAVTPPADHRVVALTGALALAAIVWSPSWRVLRHVVTVVHEGAHGVVALLAGRSLVGIRLHSDSSGLTVSRGSPHGPGMIATLAAGYLGPGMLGLLAAWVVGTGHAVGMLWALLIALAALLLQIRNLYGLWVVLASGAVLVGITGWLPQTWQAGCAYTITWFLLLAAPSALIDLHRTRRRGGARQSDPDQLARLTWLPAGAWTGLMLLLDLGALALGARLMLG